MSAALAWIGHALDTLGEVLADGRTRVRRSQAALAEEAGCSAGTITYYPRVLGDTVSVSRRGGLVVDPVALGTGGVDELARRRGVAGEVAELLAQRWAGPADAEGRMELVDGEGRFPSVRDLAAALGLNPSTVQRHPDTLGREDRLLRQGPHLYLLGEPTSAVDGGNRPQAAPTPTGAAPAQTLDPRVLDLLATTAAALVPAAEDHGRTRRGLMDSSHPQPVHLAALRNTAAPSSPGTRAPWPGGPQPLTDLDTALRRLRALPPIGGRLGRPSPCSPPAAARRPARRRR